MFHTSQRNRFSVWKQIEHTYTCCILVVFILGVMNQCLLEWYMVKKECIYVVGDRSTILGLKIFFIALLLLICSMCRFSASIDCVLIFISLSFLWVIIFFLFWKLILNLIFFPHFIFHLHSFYFSVPPNSDICKTYHLCSLFIF